MVEPASTWSRHSRINQLVKEESGSQGLGGHASLHGGLARSTVEKKPEGARSPRERGARGTRGVSAHSGHLPVVLPPAQHAPNIRELHAVRERLRKSRYSKKSRA